MEDMKSLPTTGPLGKRENYEPTNRDLLNNAYKQNDAINSQGDEIQEVKKSVLSVDSKVQTLSETVKDHSEVIDNLKQIKSIVIWMLSFVGLGGLASFVNFLKLWGSH